MADISILKTGRLYEADMLAEALEQNKIPYYRGMETISGMRVAMPAMPVQGPGTWFTVIVPKTAATDAQAILNELPISHESTGIWSYNPKPWAKKVMIVYVWVVLIVVALSAVFNVLDWLISLFR